MKISKKVILRVVVIALVLLLSPVLLPMIFVIANATGNLGLFMLNIFLYGMAIGIIILMIYPFYFIYKRMKKRDNSQIMLKKHVEEWTERFHN